METRRVLTIAALMLVIALAAVASITGLLPGAPGPAGASSPANTLTTVDNTGDDGQYTSLKIGADKKPVVSYYDYTNADLKVAHCSDASCSASTPPWTALATSAGSPPWRSGRTASP